MCFFFDSFINQNENSDRVGRRFYKYMYLCKSEDIGIILVSHKHGYFHIKV